MKGEAGGSPFHAAASRAACPHCGYDLSGTVNSWKESCPLEGVCSECGAAVEWSRVFDAAEAPAWSCEHAPPFSVWKLCRTAILLLRPRAYWRAFTPEMPVRVGRLAWMVGVFSLVSCFVILACHTLWLALPAWQRSAQTGAPTDWAAIGGFWWSTMPDYSRNYIFGLRSGAAFAIWDALLALGFTLAFAVPVQAVTISNAKSAPTLSHLWRALAMLMMGLVTLCMARFLFVFAVGPLEYILPRAVTRVHWDVIRFLRNTRATSYVILLYGTTLWTAYILVFHKVQRGRLAVIIAWALICLGVLGYWLYPFMVRFVSR